MQYNNASRESMTTHTRRHTLPWHLVRPDPPKENGSMCPLMSGGQYLGVQGLVGPLQTVTTGLQTDTRLYTLYTTTPATLSLGHWKLVCSKLTHPYVTNPTIDLTNPTG